jgi:hypothetical protein
MSEVFHQKGEESKCDITNHKGHDMEVIMTFKCFIIDLSDHAFVHGLWGKCQWTNNVSSGCDVIQLVYLLL